MTLFIKSNEINTLPVLSVEKSQLIYESLKVKYANRLFLEDNIPTEHSVLVEKEFKRIESEVMSKMRGANDYVPTTELHLVESIISELLDVSIVVTDIINWFDGKPDENTTWKQFKIALINVEE